MNDLFEERHFPLRYPVVGVATFVLESAIYAALLLSLPAEYYLASYYGAGLVALMFNFTGHKFFTFRKQKVRHPLKQFGLEAGLKLSILATRGWILTLLVERAGLPPVSGIALSFVIAAVTFTATSWIFGGAKPKQTWMMVWGYCCLAWWYVKEEVLYYYRRFKNRPKTRPL